LRCGAEICVRDTAVVGVVGAAVVEHCTVAGEVCVPPDAVGDALGAWLIAEKRDWRTSSSEQ